MTRKKTTSVKEYLITAFWLIVAGIVMTLIMNPRSKYLVLIAAFTCCIWIFLWIGNAITSDLVSTRIEWTKAPLKRFIVGMIVMIVYTLSAVYFIVWIFKIAFDFNLQDETGLIYGSLIVTFVISLFMHGRGFLGSWRQAELEAEQAKQESIKANYESLKNQVNPHFLFNSLNALTGLVYEDQDKAAKFIKQLSEVYRYVLDTKDMEVISVDEELKFLDAYLFLQQIRFGHKLKIDNKLANLHGTLPPLAIQMLIENAIKHNVISEESPLTIKLYGESGYIVVENNLQVKRLSPSDSSGLGLENIKKRYEFLDNRKVIINNVNNIFQVKIPLLIEIS